MACRAWAQPLQGIGWHLVDTDNNRTVFDDKKQAIIQITATKHNRIHTNGEQHCFQNIWPKATPLLALNSTIY